MSRAIFSILLVLCLGAMAHDHTGDSDHSHVVVLTQESFSDFIATNELAMIEFFAPWCGHCKNLKPHYEQAAFELEGVAPLATVDCTVEKDLCSTYNIKGFPTIKLFQSGAEPTDYTGGRTTSDIVNHIKKMRSPAFTIVAASDLDALKAKEDILIVGYFADAESAQAKEFMSVATSLRFKYTFVIVIDEAKANTIELNKKGEDVATFNGAISSASIISFINSEAFPLVGAIGPENYQSYLERNLPLVWIFLDFNGDASTSNSIVNFATEVAKSTKGKLSFVKLDGIRWAEHAKHFGITEKPPGIVIEDRNTNRNYVFPHNNPITTESLQAWADSYLDSSLKPTVKTENVPASQDGSVYVLVGSTFESIVNDESKDVFVEFYAPWCGHCKTLAPKYDILGDMFKDNKNVMIAKIDATANDVPVPIKGFPTLMLFKSGSKQFPITYSGERTEQAMFDWINENASQIKAEEKKEEAKEEL